MATAFQNFVNEELPKRPYTLESTLTWGSGRILVTAGPGYGVETVPLIEAPVQSVNGDIGDVVITTSSIGAVPLTSVGALNGVAELVNGLIPTSRLPSIAIVDYLGEAADEAEMLTLDGQKGDWCKRLDQSVVWIITGNDPTQISSWTSIEYPPSPVLSVNGNTGVVVLGPTDVGADAAGTAVSEINLHLSENDPHGDRNYAEGLLISHTEEYDPHPQYVRADDVPAYCPVQSVNLQVGNVELVAEDVGADAVGTALALMDAHLNHLDPHDQYTTFTEAADAAPIQLVFGRVGEVVAQTGDYTAEQVGADPEGTAQFLVTEHESASDPHTGYLKKPATWAPSTSYLANSYFQYQGVLFKVVNSHTSGTGFYDTGSSSSNSSQQIGLLNSVVSTVPNPSISTSNTATGEFACVLNGNGNSASGSRAIVVGGNNNQATLTYSFVGGGRNNTASGSSLGHATVSGGLSNTASGDYSGVLGGSTNSATGSYSSVLGGLNNQATNTYSTVVGGQSNTASSTNAGVFGGQSNTASGPYSTIVGSQSSSLGGQLCFVASGQSVVLTSAKNSVTVLHGRDIGDNGVQSGDVVIQNGMGASAQIRPADVSHSIASFGVFTTSVEATVGGAVGTSNNRILACSSAAGVMVKLAIHTVDFMCQSADSFANSGVGIWCGRRLVMVSYVSGNAVILSTQTIGTDYVFGYTSTSFVATTSSNYLICTFNASGAPLQIDLLANAVVRSSYNSIG